MFSKLIFKKIKKYVAYSFLPKLMHSSVTGNSRALTSLFLLSCGVVVVKCTVVKWFIFRRICSTLRLKNGSEGPVRK